MSIKLELEGFEEAYNFFNPQSFQQRLESKIRRATMENAQLAKAAIVDFIKSGRAQKNSMITLLAKTGSTPLVDSGALANAIEIRVVAYNEANVGVLSPRQHESRWGKKVDIIKMASILQAGATIKVTAKMRRYFAMMSKKHPTQWRPLRSTTTRIVIPPRPFMEAMYTTSLQSKYKENLEEAVASALNEG